MWSSSIRNIPGALITPIGVPMMPPWANNHALHAYRPRHVQWTWFGMNRPSGCWVLASARFQEPLSHPSACPWCHHGQITMRCTPTDQDTSNEPGLGWIGPVVAEFWHPQDSRSPYHILGHAHHNTHGQMTMPLHTYRPRQFQWIRFGVNRLSVSGVLASARFQEPLSCQWACPLCPNWQMTITLHTYRLRRFQWTWFGVNHLRGCSVMVFASFG